MTGARALAAALAIAALGGGAALAPAATPGIGVTSEAARRALREHPLRTLEGGTLTLGAMRGQVVVVNFWASWCRPCRRELPALAALHAEIARRGGRVLAISIDQDPRNAQRFLRSNKLQLPAAHDGPEGLARRLDLKAVPCTVILDRNGEVALTLGGGDQKALDRIAATTRQLLDRTPALSEKVEGGQP